MNYSDKRPEASVDIECYRDYFLLGFTEIEGKKRVAEFELYPGSQALPRSRIANIIRNYRCYSFNGNGYDQHILALAMAGAAPAQLKEASDAIIVGGLRPWEFRDRYGAEMPGYFDHVDLMEVAPGKGGLKVYGARMHIKKMRELPFPPNASIRPQDRAVLRGYRINDDVLTTALRRQLAKPLRLRELLSDKYGVDLRSKSDAQAAEAVFRKLIADETGVRPQKLPIEPGKTFKYTPPPYISFETPELQEILRIARTATFEIGYDGKVKPPLALRKRAVEFDGQVYTMGIGGLHSTEKSVSHYSDDNVVILDRDVTSFYPRVIITSGLVPRALGQAFLRIYVDLVNQRLTAKSAGLKEDADSLKIFINGVFGKLASPHSIFYSPELMIQVTLTGQLWLLMFIERVTLAGGKVLSANTDGVVTMVPRERLDDFHAAVFDMEMDSDADTEETEYVSLHSRDVNNYVALSRGKKGVEVKGKGAYANPLRSKSEVDILKLNPANGVCVDAVHDYLSKGVSIEKTVLECTDLRKFISTESVTGGAYVGDEEPIGKVVRWYYSTEVKGCIRRCATGNAVGSTEGAMPVPDFPDEFPEDIDHRWYITEAYGMLRQAGVSVEKPSVISDTGRSGIQMARLPGQKNIHVIDLSTNVAVCGAELKGLHDRWIEYDTKPVDHRNCAKCARALGV